MDISNWYNTTMTILAYVNAADTSASWTQTETTVFSDVPCRIRAKTGYERNILGKQGEETTHRIYCQTTHGGTPIVLVSQKNFIKIGSREFDITFPNDPHEVGDFLQIDVTLRT